MKRHFLMVVLALTTLVACKKEKGADTDGPSNPSSSKTLKRIVETKAGQTTTYNFSYNAGKQLTSVKSTDNSETLSFTYDGNGNVTKIESKEGSDREVLEFTYANGIPLTGSFKSYELNEAQAETLAEQYAFAYTVENNLVTKIKAIVPADPENDEDGYELDYNLTYTNGNLTKVESVGMFSYTATFTYGNKKPVFPKVLKYALDPAGFSLEFFAKNDLLSKSFDYPGTEMDDAVTNVYTYDADGYVLTSNDGEMQTTFQYE
jgi:YD repeat-containing protein